MIKDSKTLFAFLNRALLFLTYKALIEIVFIFIYLNAWLSAD